MSEVKRLVDMLEEGKDFAIEQAPQLFNEIILQGYIASGTTIAVASIFTLIFSVVSYIAYKDWKETTGYAKDDCVVGLVGFLCLTLVTIVITVASIYNILTIYLTPKLYVLQEVASLLGDK